MIMDYIKRNSSNRDIGFITKCGRLFAACAIFGAVLAGCGGGGGGTSLSGTSLSGVAAAGAPVINGVGYALDAATGQHVNFTTDSSGNYSVNLGTRTGPFLLHVIGFTAAGAPVDLYSLASSAGGTANITPLSDVVLAYASGVTTQNLEAACIANVATCHTLLTNVQGNLTAANGQVIGAIPANVLANFGLSSTSLNVFTTPFTVNHTGLDALLDTILVTQPTVANTSYTLALAGASVTTLATVPTSGTAGTQSSSSPTPGSTVSSTALAQATNLAAAAGEVMTRFASFTALFATSLPTSAQVSPYLDSSLSQLFSGPGFNATNLTSGNAITVGSVLNGGALAAYSGAPFTSAPAPAVTYDGNNCVKSMWVHFVINGRSSSSIELNDAIPTTNTAGICTGGTWTMAGNGRSYDGELTPGFSSYGNAVGGIPTYSAVLGLYADTQYSTANASAASPWTTVKITGPGLTTMANPGSSVSGSVTLIAPPVSANYQSWASISDPASPASTAYGTPAAGSNQLKSCTDSTLVQGVSQGVYPQSTPCFNTVATAGSDYRFDFYNGTTLLESDMNRLHVTLSAISVYAVDPYFPNITAVTPAASSITTAGATVTTTYALPAGTAQAWQFIQVYDTTGNSLSRIDAKVATNSSSNALSTGTLTSSAATGQSGVSIDIGELSFLTVVSF